MKLKDGFYVSSRGIGSLMLGMPTKNPKKKKRARVDDMACCEAGGFIYPFRGYVEHLHDHPAIIRIENTMECDKWLAKGKENLAVARLVGTEVTDNEI